MDFFGGLRGTENKIGKIEERVGGWERADDEEKQKE
jgi:hypothetical protein